MYNIKVEKTKDIHYNRLQLIQVTRNKREYFEMYSFKIAVVSSKRELIDMINSRVETVLLGSEWTITHTYNIKVSMTIALSDNTTDKKKINMVDAYRLYKNENGGIIKFTIYRRLNTKNYSNINMLINYNFIKEAGIFVYDIL